MAFKNLKCVVTVTIPHFLLLDMNQTTIFVRIPLDVGARDSLMFSMLNFQQRDWGLKSQPDQEMSAPLSVGSSDSKGEDWPMHSK